MTAADVILLGPPTALLALALFAATYQPLPGPCAIHATPCPDQIGCVVAYQAECAAHGLPLLATGGEA